MNPRNNAGTKKLQVYVDETTDRVLAELSPVGIRGKNKSEVAYGIIREWIWHNQEYLKNCGIALTSKNNDAKQ
jgi:hypothetical protein